jgi:hypothetical protein
VFATFLKIPDNPGIARKSLSEPLFAVGLGWARILVLLMTAFAGVVDLRPALQYLPRVLRVCRIDRQGRGVVKTMCKCDPSLAV